MTVSEAKSVLKNPQFGNPIEALEFLRKVEECAAILKSTGHSRQIVCSLCNGDPDHRCECGDYHECQMCDGTGLAQGVPEELGRFSVEVLEEAQEIVQPCRRLNHPVHPVGHRRE